MEPQSMYNIAADDTNNRRPDEPCVLVVFGATGDVSRRLVLPALYNLACDGLLPQRFAFIGVGRSDMSDAEYRDVMSAEIVKLTTRPQVDIGVWEALARRLHYLRGWAGDAETCAGLASLVAKLNTGAEFGNVICYLNVLPSLYPAVSTNLRDAGFNQRTRGWTRLIIQRSIGPDLGSTVRLNRALLDHWSEDQIYRIDPCFGTEAAWNVLKFRFGDGPFEPQWNKDHIDHMQFTLFDSTPVEGRGGYFDASGLTVDLVHLLAFFSCFGMDRPVLLSAEEFRNERVRVMQAVRHWSAADVSHNAVRGQYGAGGGYHFGYRGAPSVNPSSAMETFAAIRLFIDNARWHGMPIYLRSGKAVSIHATYAVVEFKAAPTVPFQNTAVAEVTGNGLFFQIAPSELFTVLRGTGQERVILRCMKGDLTPFMRTDLVEATCRIVQQILDAWANQPPPNFPNYAVGTSGPQEAADLLAQDGRCWAEVVSRGTQGRLRLL